MVEASECDSCKYDAMQRKKDCTQGNLEGRNKPKVKFEGKGVKRKALFTKPSVPFMMEVLYPVGIYENTSNPMVVQVEEMGGG